MLPALRMRFTAPVPDWVRGSAWRSRILAMVGVLYGGIRFWKKGAETTRLPPGVKQGCHGLISVNSGDRVCQQRGDVQGGDFVPGGLRGRVRGQQLHNGGFGDAGAAFVAQNGVGDAGIDL